MTSPLTRAALVPEARRLTDRYEFLQELGRGGMAIVYLARERESGASVAIKLLGDAHVGNSESMQRFTREARTVAALEHPNIVRTLAVEELGGSAVAIISEYVPGRTLRTVLNDTGALSFDDTASIMRDIASALAHAHARRLVHRDVKPENIFIEAATGRALLADFGIARPIEPDTLLTTVGASIGTPTYMAPEQVMGRDVDERVDVYSLGLLGWEMLTGSRPWKGESLYSVLHKQQHERLPSVSTVRPDTPVYLLQTIEGALAKLPDKRWRDGAAMLARLTPRVGTRSPAPPRASAPAPALTVPIVVPVRAAPPSMPAPTISPVATPIEADAKRLAFPVSGLRELPPSPGRGLSDGGIDGRRSRRSRRTAWPYAAGLAALFALTAVLANGIRNDSGDGAIASASRDSLLNRSSSSGGEVAISATDSAPDWSGPPTPPVVPTESPNNVPRPATRVETPKRMSPPAVRPPAARAPRASAPTRARSARARASAASPRCASSASGAQRACLLAAINRNDVALNRTYQALIGQLRRAAGNVREPSTVRALRGEQRAWLNERDRTCRRSSAATSETLWGAERAPCFARASTQREIVLRRRLKN